VNGNIFNRQVLLGMNTLKAALIILSFFLLLQSCTTFRQEPQSQNQGIQNILESDFFNSSQAAVSVYDLTANKSLFKKNEKLLFRPASNQKILTTASALLFLGPEYNFTTDVYHTGEIKDSVVTGDVFIRGGFDPFFSSKDLDSIVFEIKKKGVKSIEGNLYGDVSAMDSLVWGEGWMWDDESAYLSPLTINGNAIIVSTAPGKPGEPALVKIFPETNFVSVINSAITIDTGKTTIYATRNWFKHSNEISIKGVILKSEKEASVPIRIYNPTFYFLTLLKECFERNGIIIKGKIDTLTLQNPQTKLFSVKHNLAPDITHTNKVSDNLGAELILRTIALEKTGKHASAKKGIAYLDSLIVKTGLNPDNYRLADGSGVSFYNLISSELLIEVLKYFYYKQPHLFPELLDSFPVAGVDGTLSNRMKDVTAYKNVFAKTGTLSNASTISGYIKSKNKHLLAFSILIQNYPGSPAKAREIQDKLCELFYEQN
jgi:D-alanyl-D-alanine carboxypeptidase/D-alanyl-D-alanine-endopeptidase (penicillin-binding protein 4)